AVEVQVRLSAARPREDGISDGPRHPFRLQGCQGMAPPPTARRRCDRPVAAGRPTAPKGSAATSARARPADRYQDNPSQGCQPIREPGRNPSEADSTPLPTTRWRIVTDHPSLHHSLRSAGPVTPPPPTPRPFCPHQTAAPRKED